jgi:hypothetical protein
MAAQRRLQQQPAQVRGRAHPGVAEVDLGLVLVDPGGQFAVVVGRQCRPADDRHRHFVDHPQILEVALDLERNVAHQGGHGGHADVMQQDGVAIGWRLGDLVGADGTAGAAGVVDHDAHAQWLAHGFGQIPRDAVGGAAGGEGHDDGDGAVFCRPFALRQGTGRKRRERREGGNGRRFMDKLFQCRLLKWMGSC